MSVWPRLIVCTQYSVDRIPYRLGSPYVIRDTDYGIPALPQMAVVPLQDDLETLDAVLWLALP